jgi:hypothetical protein
MAYPMLSQPVWTEVLALMQDRYGVECVASQHFVIDAGARGIEKAVYLRRMIGESVLIAPMPQVDGDGRITHTVFSSIGRNLDLPAADFGYSLGWL